MIDLTTPVTDLPSLPQMGNFNNYSSMFQDALNIGGLFSPGVAEITAFSHPRKWDVRGAYGVSGAPIVYTGDENAEFTVTLRHWVPPDLDLRWLLFASILDKRPVGVAASDYASIALPFIHAILSGPPHNIDAVVVKEVTPWLQDEFGEWTMTIKFLQFVAPKPALGKPDKTIPSIQGQNGEIAAGTQGGGDPAELTVSNLADQVFAQGSPGGAGSVAGTGR